MERVHRSQLKNAPYNPRVIQELNERKLRETLRTEGLVEALTWNRKTGHLVGGHQRLAQLDVLEKDRAGDYELDVCVVDVSPKKEKRLNLLLNNDALQGDYDPTLLMELFTSDEDAVSPEDGGFDQVDLELLLEADDFARLYPTLEPETAEEDADAVNLVAGRKAPPAPSGSLLPPPGTVLEDDGEGSDPAPPAPEPKRNAAGRVMSESELAKYNEVLRKRAAMRDELGDDPLTEDVATLTLKIVCGTLEEREDLGRILCSRDGLVDCRILYDKLGVSPPKMERA